MLDLCNCSDVGTVIALTQGTPITTGAANTKGSWTQLVSATQGDIYHLTVLVDVDDPDNTGASIGIDIGIGAAASEVVVISNLPLGLYQARSIQRLTLPVFIPAGSRVSCRAQCSQATVTFHASAVGYSAGLGAIETIGSGAESIGFSTASSYGTHVFDVDQNVMGAWTELVASTLRDYIGLAGKILVKDNNGGKFGMINIGIGSAGSEVIIIPSNLYTLGQGTPGGVIDFIPMPIPAGTRIAAQCQLGSSGGGADTYVSLIGVY